MTGDSLQNAKTARRAGRVEEAAVLLRQYVDEHPASASAWFELALAEMDLGHLKRSREALSKVTTMEPDSLRGMFAEAELLEQEGRLEESIAATRVCVERSPEVGVFRWQLARRLRKAGRYEESLAACDEAEEKVGASAELATQRGFCLDEQVRPRETVRAFAQAVRLRGDNPRGRAAELSCLGVSLAHMGRTRCAIACYERGLEEEPEFEELHHNLGVSLRGLDPARAEECFRTAIKLDPRYVNSHLELGWVLAHMKRYEEAEDAVRKGMALDDTEGPWSHIYLGNVYRSAERMEPAEQEYRRAIETFPEHTASQWSLASFLREQGRGVEAHAHQAEAMLRRKSQPGSVFLLMLDLWDSGRREEARRMMRRQLLDPEPGPYRAWIRVRLATPSPSSTACA